MTGDPLSFEFGSVRFTDIPGYSINVFPFHPEASRPGASERVRAVVDEAFQNELANPAPPHALSLFRTREQELGLAFQPPHLAAVALDLTETYPPHGKSERDPLRADGFAWVAEVPDEDDRETEDEDPVRNFLAAVRAVAPEHLRHKPKEKADMLLLGITGALLSTTLQIIQSTNANIAHVEVDATGYAQHVVCATKGMSPIEPPPPPSADGLRTFKVPAARPREIVPASAIPLTRYVVDMGVYY